MTDMPKLGDLRVWNIINVPNEPAYYPVKNPAHAQRLIDALADSQLLQPEITSNVFGLEVFAQDGWEEWYDPEGLDVREAHVDDPDVVGHPAKKAAKPPTRKQKR
jgi:hypothetical protein